MKKYICLTTIPPRFNQLNNLVEDFLKKFDVDGIRIYIPQNYLRFNIKNLNSMIPKIDNDKVTIIRTLKDYGPLTKTLGPLLDSSIKDDDCIIITDDDSFKNKSWLKILMFLLNKNNNSFIQISNNINTQIHGSNGFCFIKKTIHKKNFINFINKIPVNFYFIDDDLLTIYLNISKIKIIKSIFSPKKQYFLQQHGLVNNNNRFFIRKNLNSYIKQKFNITYNYQNFF